MNNLIENKIASEEELKKRLISSKPFLYDGVYNYMLDLLYLNENPFNFYDGKNKYDSRLLKAQNELLNYKLYRDIVAYNLYKRSMEYGDNNKIYTLCQPTFKNGVIINYKQSFNKIKLYSFTYEEDDTYKIEIFIKQVKNIIERAHEIKRQVDEILFLFREYEKEFGDVRYLTNYEYLKGKLENLEGTTRSELEEEYDKDVIIAHEGRLMLERVLDDYKLNLKDDFYEDKDTLVCQKRLIKIIVNK